jgi:hypothetical protein
MLQAEWSLAQFPMMSLDYSVDLILRAVLWPGVDSASNTNVHQGAGGGRVVGA